MLMLTRLQWLTCYKPVFVQLVLLELSIKGNNINNNNYNNNDQRTTGCCWMLTMSKLQKLTCRRPVQCTTGCASSSPVVEEGEGEDWRGNKGEILTHSFIVVDSCQSRN